MSNCKLWWLILLLVSFCLAGIKEDYFHIGLSAKALALGGTAFGFGVDSLYSNPAGLAVIPNKQYTYSYKSSFFNMLNTMTMQYMSPHKRGAWGLGIIHTDNSDAEKTRINNFDRPEVVGEFGEQQIGISIAYAIPVWGDSALGTSIRYYHNQMDNEYANAYGLCFGYIKKINYNFLYGLSINNLSLSSRIKSTPIMWSTGHTDYFPLRISNSIAYRCYLYGKQLEVFADIHTQEVCIDGAMESFYSTGAMLWVIPRLLNVRVGLNDEIISLGLGFRFGSWSIDYAYLHHNYLGKTYHISFGYKPSKHYMVKGNDEGANDKKY